MQQIQISDLLSAREVDVIRLVAQGCSDREIASILTISINTVRSHLMRIRSKLGYEKHSHEEIGSIRVRIALYALKSGLVKAEGIVPDSVYVKGLQDIRTLIDNLINKKGDDAL